MYKQYDQDVLIKVQKAELMILQDFGDVCKKYSIPWFAIGGTAIGCARHKGFIPWDDDIDVGMIRSDYDRFCQIWEKELGRYYQLTTPETVPSYSSAVVKLMRKGTKFVPTYAAKSQLILGLHIDIFIYDNYTDDKRSIKQINRARMWDQLLFLRAYSKPEIPGNGWKRKVLQITCSMIHLLLSLFHISPTRMYRQLTKESEKYDEETTEYVTSFQDPKIQDSRLKMDEIFPLQWMTFEDTRIPMMHNYMSALTRYYGEDVMQLPSEEKRVNHAPEIIDFGTIFDR
jgi:lipopolysaccharide cholinephosphotransferase